MGYAIKTPGYGAACTASAIKRETVYTTASFSKKKKKKNSQIRALFGPRGAYTHPASRSEFGKPKLRLSLYCDRQVLLRRKLVSTIFAERLRKLDPPVISYSI